MFQTVRHLFLPQSSNNHRPHILHLEWLFALVVFVGCIGVSTHALSSGTRVFPSVLGFSSTITASQVVDQTNQQRAANGVGQLTTNQRLVQAAIAKGNNMCAEQYWAHISPKGTTPWVFIKNAGYSYSVAGENLARDFGDTSSMVQAWMASPTHRANMVNGKYKEIGVAVVNCSLLGSDTALVVQMFGSQIATIPSVGTSAAAKTTPRAVAQGTPTPAVQSAQDSTQVEGKESTPVLLANADPTLVLTTPVPSYRTGMMLFTPLQVIKAVFGSILVVLLFILGVDMWLAQKRQTVRSVGKNTAHMLFLGSIFLLLLLSRSGMIF